MERLRWLSGLAVLLLPVTGRPRPPKDVLTG